MESLSVSRTLQKVVIYPQSRGVPCWLDVDGGPAWCWEGLDTYSCHEGGLPAVQFHPDL